MASNEISLQWNGYQNYMINNLKALFHDEGYADVTLVTEGECSKAHKVVLSACSSLFRNIFKQNPCDHPIVVLHDITSYTLRILLSFIYNGEVCVSEDYLPILLNAADSLKINGLSVDADKGYNYSVKSHLPLSSKRNWETTAPDLSQDIKIEIEPDIQIMDTLQLENNQSVPEKMIQKREVSDIIVPRKTKAHKKFIKTKKSNENSVILNKHSVHNDKHNGIRDSILMQDKCKKMLKCNKKRQFKQISNGTSKIEMPPQQKISKENETFETDVDFNVVDCDNRSSKKCLPDKSDKTMDTFMLTEKPVESPDTTDFCDESRAVVPNEEYSSPTFPCPFCSRVYLSWGYRRRHVKSRHTVNTLSCKSCRILSSSQMAWYEHAVHVHGVPKSVARDGLVVMVEAHSVFASSPPNPTSLIDHLQLDTCDLTNANG